jgi:hypothetical protein
MEEDYQHIFQNWDKYFLPVFYSKVTMQTREPSGKFYEKYVPIAFYQTMKYPVQIPIKPLSKTINIYE